MKLETDWPGDRLWVKGFSEQGKITSHPELPQHCSLCGLPAEGGRSTLCCPRLQYVALAFPGNPLGAWGGAITSKGLWYEELSGSRGMAGVMQDVCDRGWVEGYPPVSPQTTLQEPYMEDKDRDDVWAQMDPGAFFKFWPFLEHVTSWHFGCRFWACRPHSTYLCVTTVGIDSFIFCGPQGC